MCGPKYRSESPSVELLVEEHRYWGSIRAAEPNMTTPNSDFVITKLSKALMHSALGIRGSLDVKG